MSESFTIQISSDLVSRLIEEGEKAIKKTRKPKPKVSQEPTSQITLPKQLPDDSEMKGPPSVGWPTQPPLFLPAPPIQPFGNPELDAIRSVLQQSEKVVEWLQKEGDKLVLEVTERAKDLHDKEFNLPQRKPMRCLNEKDGCLNCYKENVKDPLKCAQVVKTFADCARKAQQQVG